MHQHARKTAAAIKDQVRQQHAQCKMVHRDQRRPEQDRLGIIKQRANRQPREECHVDIGLQRHAARGDQESHDLGHHHGDSHVAEGCRLPAEGIGGDKRGKTEARQQAAGAELALEQELCQHRNGGHQSR
jgi:hypothetical protein